MIAALVDWVVKGTAPPPSRYPTLADGQLAPAATVAASFPKIPGVAVPEVNHVLDYDFGDGFDYGDISGAIAQLPPPIRKVVPTLVPRVNADGNETAGVASPLHQAPLGTYLGWNVTAVGILQRTDLRIRRRLRAVRARPAPSARSPAIRVRRSRSATARRKAMSAR